jgi:deazaflavin-dependent oxidoreductase (nitroreductase family)
MMTATPVTPPPARHVKRPLLGVRRKPGRLALMFMRMPLRAYRHDMGHLLGHTFLEFTHVGRNTGTAYHAVAMVLHYDRVTGQAVICAAWGPDSDWYRNLQAHPATNVKLGRDSFTPEQRFLSDEQAFEVGRTFRAAHPHRLRLFSRILAWGDLDDDARVREFVQGHPMVAFRPTSQLPG